MKAVLALAPRLQRSGGSTTTVLSVVAFAVTTAFGLSVLGGLLGFIGRVDDPPQALVSDGTSAKETAEVYVVLAAIAVVLLVVPLVSLAGAAARMGVSRRDARLATLRLLGVTAREVRLVTAVETAAQGLAGAVLGGGDARRRRRPADPAPLSRGRPWRPTRQRVRRAGDWLARLRT